MKNYLPRMGGLQLEDLAEGVFDGFQVFGRYRAHLAVEAVLGDGADLVHYGDRRPGGSVQGHQERRAGQRRGRKRNHDDGAASLVVYVGSHDKIRAGLAVFGTRGRVERRIRQTSPRRGVMPRLLDAGREGVEVALEGDEVGILVGKIAGLSQLAVVFDELAGELCGEAGRKCESYLTGGHIAILPHMGGRKLLAADGRA